MAPDLDPHNLDEVRRRVVGPVVASLVRPDELEEIAVNIDPGGHPFDYESLRVALKARGEWVGVPTYWTVRDGALWDAESFAGDLYDRLRDELTESRFAWGQLRDGDHEVLGPLEG